MMKPTDIPVRYRSLYRRAMRGKSRKAALHAHCMMCCGWQYREVAACTAPTCPLYPYRPGACETVGNGETQPQRSTLDYTDPESPVSIPVASDG